MRAVDGAWVAEDAGSSNGTYVDGRRLERFRIEADTTVRLGDPETGPELRLSLVDVPPGPVAAEPHGPETVLATAAVAVVRPGEMTVLHDLHAGVVTIGRSPSCDVVIDDPLVSRRHAELRQLPSGRRELADLGSHNGTFVNGRRIDKATLDPLDLVGIGGSEFRVVGEQLQEITRKAEVGLAAVGISVVTKAGTVLADDIGFALEEGSLLAVVGPSGAGNSTLLGALTGVRRPRRRAACTSAAATCTRSTTSCGSASASSRRTTSSIRS